MQLDDVLYDDIFNNLPKEKQLELIGRKDDFAKKGGYYSVKWILQKEKTLSFPSVIRQIWVCEIISVN